jgi:uncharacterized protein
VQRPPKLLLVVMIDDLRYSKYNIFSKIRDSENYFIVNPLSGNADILNTVEAEKLNEIRCGGDIQDLEFTSELVEKGYLAEEAEENKLFLNRYLDFIDSRDKDEIQLFFVTNYSCNLPVLIATRTSTIIRTMNLVLR